MKKIFNTIAILAVALAAVSCHYLDKAPEEDLTIEEAFLKRNYAEAFLTDIYAGIPYESHFSDYADVNPFTAASDEMILSWSGKFCQTITRGSMNPYNAVSQLWVNMYEGIRKANIFLEHIDITPISDDFTEKTKKRWIAEAHMLKALYHYYLIRTYGPCIIMDHTVSANDNFNLLKQSPLDDCIDYVLKEIELAVPDLPMKITDASQYGHMNAAIGYAIRSRLLLYRARPLFNGCNLYKDFTDNDGINLFPTEYDAGKWQEAANAAKQAIEACEAAGYALYYAKSGDPVESYQQLFIDNWNCECLYSRTVGFADDGYWWVEKCCYPNYLGGWGGCDPTQQMVDAYEMADGSTPILGYNDDGSPIINAASGYKETGFATADDPNGRWVAGVSNMYVNREPRFYASINFNGAIFKDHQIELWNSGVDGRGNTTVDYCCSGYMMKKHCNPAVTLTGTTNYVLKTWVMWRLGEIYLNYAEALNEAQGPVADVYKYVDAIRTRAGLPGLPKGLSKDEMREKIWHERRIELAFETHRYFDTHTWMIAPETQAGPVYGMNIAAGTSLQDPEYYKRTLLETRVFPYPQYYLYPISQGELDKMAGLVQNPYWE